MHDVSNPPLAVRREIPAVRATACAAHLYSSTTFPGLGTAAPAKVRTNVWRRGSSRRSMGAGGVQGMQRRRAKCT